MMRYFVEIGLFENTQGVITCLKIARRLDKSMTSNPQMREIIDKLKSHDSVMIESEKPMQDKIRLHKNRIEKNETKKPSKAKPSNADEVQSYFAERGYGEPGVGQQFIDHYDSIGWKRGKQPVKDWKATARTWMARMQNTTKNKCDTKVDETFRGVDW